MNPPKEQRLFPFRRVLEILPLLSQVFEPPPTRTALSSSSPAIMMRYALLLLSSSVHVSVARIMPARFTNEIVPFMGDWCKDPTPATPPDSEDFVFDVDLTSIEDGRTATVELARRPTLPSEGDPAPRPVPVARLRFAFPQNETYPFSPPRVSVLPPPPNGTMEGGERRESASFDHHGGFDVTSLPRWAPASKLRNWVEDILVQLNRNPDPRLQFFITLAHGSSAEGRAEADIPEIPPHLEGLRNVLEDLGKSSPMEGLGGNFLGDTDRVAQALQTAILQVVADVDERPFSIAYFGVENLPFPDAETTKEDTIPPMIPTKSVKTLGATDRVFWLEAPPLNVKRIYFVPPVDVLRDGLGITLSDDGIEWYRERIEMARGLPGVDVIEVSNSELQERDDIMTQYAGTIDLVLSTAMLCACGSGKGSFTCGGFHNRKGPNPFSLLSQLLKPGGAQVHLVNYSTRIGYVLSPKDLQELGLGADGVLKTPTMLQGSETRAVEMMFARARIAEDGSRSRLLRVLPFGWESAVANSEAFAEEVRGKTFLTQAWMGHPLKKAPWVALMLV